MNENTNRTAARVAGLHRALVIGAGTMGSGIARLLTASGFAVNLVDPFEANLNRAADAIKIPAEARFRALVPEAVRDVDLVIEAASEDRDLKKQQVYKVIAEIAQTGGLKPGLLIGSNTSSIPITELSEALPTALRGNFMGTHFFNPAHYMKLLELIPGKHTSPETQAAFLALAQSRLSKEVAIAADLPGFIVNRLLIFDFANQVHDVANDLFTIEEIDAVMGDPVGRPMGPFQLADLVGIDLFEPIGKVIYHGVPDDSLRDCFLMPSFLTRMVAGGKLGAKSKGQGFYSMAGRTAQAVYDIASDGYKPLAKIVFPSVQQALREKDILKRLDALLFAPSNDRGREIARRYILGLLNYTRRLIGNIGDADSIETGMLYGLNHRIGPAGILRSPLGERLTDLSRQLWQETHNPLFEVV